MKNNRPISFLVTYMYIISTLQCYKRLHPVSLQILQYMDTANSLKLSMLKSLLNDNIDFVDHWDILLRHTTYTVYLVDSQDWRKWNANNLMKKKIYSMIMQQNKFTAKLFNTFSISALVNRRLDWLCLKHRRPDKNIAIIYVEKVTKTVRTCLIIKY